MVTILTEDGAVEAPMVAGAPGALWLDAAAAERATGWSLKPEGLCRGDVCVPVPAGRTAEFVQDNEVDLAAFWRLMGRPAVHDEDGAVWSLGAGAADRTERLRSLEAPDFALPDLAGRTHRLTDQRGRKVFLVTWASW